MLLLGSLANFLSGTTLWSSGNPVDKHPAAWFIVDEFVLKLCFHHSFKHISRLFWVLKKVLRYAGMLANVWFQHEFG